MRIAADFILLIKVGN